MKAAKVQDDDHEIVGEAYELFKRAAKTIVKVDPLFWGPKAASTWSTRYAVVRYICLLKFKKVISRRGISNRLIAIDGRAGALAALKEVESSCAPTSSRVILARHTALSTPTSSPSTGLKELDVLSEVYNLHYLLKVDSSKKGLVCDFVSSETLHTATQLHPFLINLSMYGSKFTKFQIVYRGPWALAAEGSFIIQGEKPNSALHLPLIISNSGKEDAKTSTVRFPNQALRRLGEFDLSTSQAVFQFHLTYTSQFANLVLATMVDEVPPISAFRVIMRFEDGVKQFVPTPDQVRREDGPELSSQSVRIPIQSEQVCREDLAFDLSKQSSLAEEAASDDIVMRGATYGEGFVASSRSPPRVLECPLASFDELSTFSGSVSSSISSDSLRQMDSDCVSVYESSDVLTMLASSAPPFVSTVFTDYNNRRRFDVA